LILILGAAIGVALLAGAAFHLNSARSSYNRYVDLALFENGVKINLIGASSFSRNQEAGVIEVGIDADSSEESKSFVRSAYGFLASLSGRTLNVTDATANLFGQSRSVYVASPSRSLQNGVDDFVQKLRNSAQQTFPNERAGEFWAYLSSTVGKFNGAPFFFNSEFAGIDFDNVIKNATQHRLANTKIEHSVVYVNTPFLEGRSASENQMFTNYVALQEIFQDYNLASDVNDPEFKLKTILYDHDEALGNLTGAQRRDELRKNAATGLCLFDVMLTKQLGQNAGNAPAPVGIIAFLSLQVSAYYHRWSGDDDLFDRRCW